MIISNDDKKTNSENDVNNRNTIRLWSLFLIILLIVVGSFLIWFTYTNTQEELLNIEYQIDPDLFEQGLAEEDYQIPGNATKILTGIYVDRIRSISIKDNTWSVDFYIWFKWTGNATPGETFQVMDGSIDKKEIIRNITMGNEKFALYKVSSTITKEFDMFRFPVDNQFLSIIIQDRKQGRDELIYVADNESSSVGTEVYIPGYVVESIRVVEKPYYYNSTMGDPNNRTVYSEFRSGILISREDLTVAFISLIGTFIAVFAGLMSLLVFNPQARFGMEGSAMFVAITNFILITNLAPTGIITLAHLINAYGLFIIALCLLTSALSLTFHKTKIKQKRLEETRKLDVRSLIILGIGFLSTVFLMILVAI